MDELYGMPGTALEEPMRPISARPVVSPEMVYIDLQDERVQDVIGRVCRAIQSAYPDAEFSTYIGTNPLGIYIEIYTTGDHFSGILQTVTDKLGNLHIAAGVNVCILPRQKVEAKAA